MASAVAPSVAFVATQRGVPSGSGESAPVKPSGWRSAWKSANVPRVAAAGEEGTSDWARAIGLIVVWLATTATASASKPSHARRAERFIGVDTSSLPDRAPSVSSCRISPFRDAACQLPPRAELSGPPPKRSRAWQNGRFPSPFLRCSGPPTSLPMGSRCARAPRWASPVGCGAFCRRTNDCPTGLCP